MHDPANELPRIPILGTSVNKPPEQFKASEEGVVYRALLVVLCLLRMNLHPQRCLLEDSGSTP